VTPRQIVIVTVRLLAIWLGIDVLRALPTFFISGITVTPGYNYTMFSVALTGVVKGVGYWEFLLAACLIFVPLALMLAFRPLLRVRPPQEGETLAYYAADGSSDSI